MLQHGRALIEAEQGKAQLEQRIREATAEIDARRLAQDVALAVQAALLRQHAPDFVFDAFCRSRLGGDWGQTFGMLASNAAFDEIVARAMPGQAL